MKSRPSRLLSIDITYLERTCSLDVATATTSVSAQSGAYKKAAALPIALPTEAFDTRQRSRAGRLAQEKDHRQQLAELTQELRDVGGDTQRKAELFRSLTDLQVELQQIQAVIAENFVPRHSQGQLISPQDLLVSRLFNVKNKATQRVQLVQFDLRQC